MLRVKSNTPTPTLINISSVIPPSSKPPTAMHPPRPNERGQSRPYRSKRHRPCDVCRRRKHGCFVDQHLPCRACRHLGIECTFNEAPRKRNNSFQDQQHHQSLPSPPSIRLGEMPGVTDAEAGDEGDEDATSDHMFPTPPFPNKSPTISSAITTAGSFSVNGDSAPQTELPILPQFAHHDFWIPASSLLDPSLCRFPPLFEDIEDICINDQNQQSDTQGPSTLSGIAAAALLPPGSTWNSAPHHAGQTNRSRGSNGNPVARSVRSLGDFGTGTTAEYSILAGEVDPYLLRHMRFNDQDTCNFGQFQYRCLAYDQCPGEPLSSQNHPPVQFLVSHAGHVSTDAEDRTALSKLVPHELGARLIGLFLRYVFPSLPVISRSRLQVRPETLIPPIASMDSLHPGLLAAIYAVAGSYRRYDPVLCVTQAEAVFPVKELWQFSNQSILRNLHTSQMHVMQAILIYTQRSIDDTTATTTDSPGDWPLLGAAVNIAKHLGLHLDCLDWPIPAWEKRLRRRLWWIVYSEATFRGLLRGLPRLIHAEDWHVSPLNESDFEMGTQSNHSERTIQHEQAPDQTSPCPYCHLGFDFRYLASLSTITYDINQSLYTVAAAKKLGHNYSATLAVARPLLKRLDEWRDSLPPQLSPHNVCDLGSRPYFHSGSAAHLKLASLTLQVLVYRALVRPLHGLATTSQSTAQGTILGIHGCHEYHFEHQGDTEEAVGNISGSIDLAKRVLSFTQGLTSYDRNSFAYSWASACFATISNFIMLLLIQAPTAKMARELLTILVRWIMILRDQAVTFAFIRLGLLRLDSVLWVGLENSFQLPPHVKQALKNELFPANMPNREHAHT